MIFHVSAATAPPHEVDDGKRYSGKRPSGTLRPRRGWTFIQEEQERSAKQVT
ncbi:hypothetical protein ASNO1_13020 [Corallococcus caeni]|uniref:Uncharacterized protein n=1 Tax=Corallococcus caeni TaxID=3082388 RepID=A0ABQ6QM11_9BACT|nr:hypothetical protein ASNO1_13020 [Corallococcus sp. NO1]